MMHWCLGTIYGVIGALVLIGGMGAQAHAAGPCLTGVFTQDMQVTATLADRLLDYRMEKGASLAAKAQNDQQTAETELTEAIKERSRIKAQWEQETNSAKKSQLKELFDPHEATAKKAKDRFETARAQQQEADEAKKAAANKVKELKTAFKKLKDEALQEKWSTRFC